MMKKHLHLKFSLLFLSGFSGLDLSAQSWTKIANTPDTASYSAAHFNAYNLGDSVFIATQRRTGLGSGYLYYWSDDGFATIHTYNATQLPNRPINYYPLAKTNVMLGSDFNGKIRRYEGQGNWNVLTAPTGGTPAKIEEMANGNLLLCPSQNPAAYHTASVVANFTAVPTGYSGRPFQSSLLLTSPNRMLLGFGALGTAGIGIIDNGNISATYSATLNPAITSSSQFIRKIQKDNSGNLYAHVYGSIIYKSTDNGLNWNALNTTFSPSGSGGYYEDMEVMNDGSILIITANGSKLYRSTDAGATASQYQTGMPATGVFATFDSFIKLRNGTVVCNVNCLNSTTFAVDAATSGLYKLSSGPVTVGVTETGNNDQAFLMFPNPASDQVRFFFHENITGKLRVQAINGELVYETVIRGEEFLLDKIPASGIYVVTVETEQALRTQKLVITK